MDTLPPRKAQPPRWVALTVAVASGVLMTMCRDLCAAHTPFPFLPGEDHRKQPLKATILYTECLPLGRPTPGLQKGPSC